jgi:hypothetical protein
MVRQKASGPVQRLLITDADDIHWRAIQRAATDRRDLIVWHNCPPHGMNTRQNAATGARLGMYLCGVLLPFAGGEEVADPASDCSAALRGPSVGTFRVWRPPPQSEITLSRVNPPRPTRTATQPLGHLAPGTRPIFFGPLRSAEDGDMVPEWFWAMIEWFWTMTLIGLFFGLVGLT